MKSNHRAQSHLLPAGMIGLSLLVHLLIFWGLSFVEGFAARVVTDITFENVTTAPPRVIPRPPSASRQPAGLDDIKDIKSVMVRAATPPPPAEAAKRISDRPAAGARLAGTSSTGISVGSERAAAAPSIPGVSIGGTYGMHISQWKPPVPIGDRDAPDFSNPQHYLDLVKLKIEKHKKYPEEAKKNHLEGNVRLKFIITADGDVRNVTVEKSAAYPVLDEAAVKAVKAAAPFPAPPERFFKGEVPLQISILFQLT